MKNSSSISNRLSLAEHPTWWIGVRVRSQRADLAAPHGQYMISGGLHAGGNLDIQDVLIIPIGARL